MPKRLRDDDSNDDEAESSEFLRQAILEGDYWGVKLLLLIRDININSRFKCGLTPYQLAAGHDRFRIILLLIDHGAIEYDGDERSDGMMLRRYTRQGNFTQVRGMLEIFGVNVDAHRNGWTALHYASYRGQLEMVKLLIKYGADVHAKNQKHKGWTPLHFATYEGHLEIVKLLVQHGADSNVPSSTGRSPFHHSCEKKHFEIVKFLFANGHANVNIKNIYGQTPIFVCDWETLEFLISNNADINVKDNYGATILHRAVLRLSRDGADDQDAIDEIQLLVESGADVHAKNNTGRTPVQSASKRGNLKATKILLESGADLNAKDRFGKTALHRVCDHDGQRQEEVCRLLIANGANPNAKDKNGDTPLHLACGYGRSKISKVLVQDGADNNAQNKNGKTPLHCACENGHLDEVKFLLSRGAGTNVKTTTGKTPLDIACNNNHLDIVWLLVRQNPWLVSE